MPNGGLRMVLTSLKAYNFEPDPNVVEAFTQPPSRETTAEAVARFRAVGLKAF